MIRALTVCVLLMVSVFTLYRPALSYGFVNLDDPDNVAENKMVLDGLSVDGVYWALTTDHADYWHPITWLSFMLDSTVFGTGPWGYHFTNVALHALNTVLLLGVLVHLTGAFWRSAAVAACFALHPLRVESVVWITERKDMLSMFFFLLTLWAYANFARAAKGQGWMWYVLAFAFLALGLMAKPMLVSVPMVLLLLDIWPLQRAEYGGDIREFLRTLTKLAIEKVPLLLLSLGSCAITYVQGSKAKAGVPLHLRLPNVVVSYVRYIEKTIWPSDLCVYYSYPGMFGGAPWALWQVAGAMLLLAAITIVAVIAIRRRPWLLVGWLMYVGMLVPVIGLLQVGSQSIADRFMYIPAIGLFIMMAWSAYGLVAWRASLKIPIVMVFCAALTGWGWLTARQIPVWRSTDALYQHALAVTSHNWRMHDYYGNYLYSQKRFDESQQQVERALELLPDDAKSHVRLGYLLAQKQDYFNAIPHFERAVQIEPTNADAVYNLGWVQFKRGELQSARSNVEKAIRLNPSKADEYGRTLTEIMAKQQR